VLTVALLDSSELIFSSPMTRSKPAGCACQSFDGEDCASREIEGIHRLGNAIRENLRQLACQAPEICQQVDS
jgi:hypothetical protein